MFACSPQRGAGKLVLLVTALINARCARATGMCDIAIIRRGLWNSLFLGAYSASTEPDAIWRQAKTVRATERHYEWGPVKFDYANF